MEEPETASKAEEETSVKRFFEHFKSFAVNFSIFSGGKNGDFCAIKMFIVVVIF